MGVELHQAFLWTCNECGRDNFARAVTIEEMAMSDQIAAEREEVAGLWKEDGSLDGATLDLFCLMAPSVVTCEHCKESFPVEDE